MDMKRILQALDGASTKPVEGASSMSKFLRIVKEADLNQPAAPTQAAAAPAIPQQDPNFAKYAELMAKYDMLAAEMTPDASGVAKNTSPEFAQQVAALKAQADQLAGQNAQAWEQARKAGSAPQQSNAQIAQQLQEGANPHKVSLPVQMAMQHYQQPAQQKKQRPALIDKYFKQVEDELLAEKQQRRNLINQYASVIAERVRLKEGKDGQWHTSPSGARTNMSPSDDDYEINYGEHGAAASQDQVDTVTLDVPLLIRLLEYAREDAQTDMDLHDVAENLISLGIDGRTLTMDDYDSILGAEGPSEPVAETKTIKPKKKSDPCWSGYHQIGMKKKGNKMVPNCTKKNSGK